MNRKYSARAWTAAVLCRFSLLLFTSPASAQVNIFINEQDFTGASNNLTIYLQPYYQSQIAGGSLLLQPQPIQVNPVAGTGAVTLMPAIYDLSFAGIDQSFSLLVTNTGSTNLINITNFVLRGISRFNFTNLDATIQYISILTNSLSLGASNGIALSTNGSTVYIAATGGGNGTDTNALIITNNLSDLASAATARSNLGLGTLAQANATDALSLLNPLNLFGSAITLSNGGAASVAINFLATEGTSSTIEADPSGLILNTANITGGGNINTGGNIQGSNITANGGVFTGVGTGITSLVAANLSGTVSTNHLPAALAPLTLNNGSSLTNLNPANLTGGGLVPAGAVYTNGTGLFTGFVTYQFSLSTGTYLLNVSTNVNEQGLFDVSANQYGPGTPPGGAVYTNLSSGTYYFVSGGSVGDPVLSQITLSNSIVLPQNVTILGGFALGSALSVADGGTGQTSLSALAGQVGTATLNSYVAPTTTPGYAGQLGTVEANNLTYLFSSYATAANTNNWYPPWALNAGIASIGDPSNMGTNSPLSTIWQFLGNSVQWSSNYAVTHGYDMGFLEVANYNLYSTECGFAAAQMGTNGSGLPTIKNPNGIFFGTVPPYAPTNDSAGYDVIIPGGGLDFEIVATATVGGLSGNRAMEGFGHNGQVYFYEWNSNKFDMSNSVVMATFDNANKTVGFGGSNPVTFTNGIIIGNATNTASGTPFQTNFISGKLYTNIYGRPIEVSAGYTLTLAATTGLSELALQASGYLTNIAFELTTATIGTGGVGGMINMVVPANQAYTFTNLSTGSGNSATPVGGQILVY